MTQSCIVIGGGFTGLSAALELARAGVAVTLLESDATLGGLAGTFDVDGEPLEKFYHHWFTSDAEVMRLVEELGESQRVLLRPTRTGMYYANRTFRLSSPWDVLKFKPLSLAGRVRLGLLVLRARRIKDWRKLESITAQNWLRQLCGDEVFRVVWEPLLRGKFGDFAPLISAVWFWNKLILRGGSRGKGGKEVLAYYRGGFAALADRMAQQIVRLGGAVRCNAPAESLLVSDGRIRGVMTGGQTLFADAVVATPALPIVADLLAPHAPADYIQRLRRIRYLANICLVLELDRTLSESYWLNINDPSFPYVGVIEHTNFEPASTYGGRHIVYLSKYLTEDAELYNLSDQQVLDFSLPHLKRMFPHFDPAWVLNYHVWRARHAQPVVECHYTQLIPSCESPIEGFRITTMAQIYPEDRGTNYAIRDGRAVGRAISAELINSSV